MATANDNISKEYENWLRLMTLIHFGGKHLCCDVLFTREKLPTDGTLLFKELEHLKPKMHFEDQKEVLCPSTGSTDYNEFDLTLFTSVIEKLYGDKYKALVKDLRDARNSQFHKGNTMLSDKEFKQLWYETTHMLHRHDLDLQLVVDLENCDLFSNQKYSHIAISIQGSLERFLLP